MKKNRAFTLIELIVAMALLTIIFVSIYPIIINTNKVNRLSQNILRAETLAQNEIEELLHNSRTSSQEDFVDFFEDYNKIMISEQVNEPLKVDLNLVGLEKCKKDFKNESCNVLEVKVNSDDKVIYETEAWLRYAR